MSTANDQAGSGKTDEAPVISTQGPFGMEETQKHIFVGRLRKDGTGKLQAIAFSIEITGLKPGAILMHRLDCIYIVAACNKYSTIGQP